MDIAEEADKGEGGMRINVVLIHSYRPHLLTLSCLIDLKPMRGSRSHSQISPSSKNVQILVVLMHPFTVIVAERALHLYATDSGPASLWNASVLYSRQPREVCVCHQVPSSRLRICSRGGGVITRSSGEHTLGHNS